MPMQSGHFGTLIVRLRGGSQEAARELVETYGKQVIRAVRRRLNRQLRAKFDSQDFVQSVWASFFVHLPTIRDLDDPESLIAFLVRMANHKVIDENRRRLDAACWNVNREERLDEENPHVEAALGRPEPTPSEVAIAREEWTRLIDCPDRDRKILEMRLEGSSFCEIALELNVNERTVRRTIRRKFQKPQP